MAFWALPVAILISSAGQASVMTVDRFDPVAVDGQSTPAAPDVPGDEAAAGPLDRSPATMTDPQPAPASVRATDAQDIVVTARRRMPGDPLAAVNIEMYSATQTVDRAIVRPMAMTYERVIPSPARDGLRNFILNLHEPVVFVNFLLQLKPGKAAETAGRFVINSTIGLAGLFDVAKRKPFKLPRRRNGFSDTLGFYGVKPGPFLFLPLIGPTTVRDLVGGVVDRAVAPLYLATPPFNQPIYVAATGGARFLDRRDQADDRIASERAAPDPYTAAREDYLKQRAAEIEGLHKGDRAGGNASAPPSAITPPSSVPQSTPDVRR